MISEESENHSRRVRRIKPGVVLVVFIITVSAFLIYKIQNRSQRAAQSRSEQSGELRQPHHSSAQAHDAEWLKETPIPVLDPVTPQPDTELVLTQTVNRRPLLPDVKTVEEGELTSTSWQNPFYKLFWKNKGWQFKEDGMSSTANQFSAATFLRPYKRISVSFRVEVENKFPAFTLQLLTRDPTDPDKVLVTSAIHFQADAVEASAVVKDAFQKLKSAKLILDKSKPESVDIRLVGTGNRFVVSVGKQRVLTCAQPAQQSGKECFLSFLAHSDQVQISALRIEGE
ncbi:hypothetical protein [Gimesia aquarii]|uniref:Uncharacterized protein n=1 Tax=Gimesia aquarii TaxID=2527964 RepID=A0A517WS73_9PLAN|nr:hypothetical protein [Gimesia aquarii]QDU08112.1 hypothetical protein V202x_14750 [Gimesia aquarii]